MVSLCLRQMCSELYIGSFTKVAWVDLTEAVEGDTAPWYGRDAPVPVLAKASRAWLSGLHDLGIGKS
jgi:hypothetical protein